MQRVSGEAKRDKKGLPDGEKSTKIQPDNELSRGMEVLSYGTRAGINPNRYGKVEPWKTRHFSSFYASRVGDTVYYRGVG